MENKLKIMVEVLKALQCTIDTVAEDMGISKDTARIIMETPEKITLSQYRGLKGIVKTKVSELLTN